MSIYEKTNVARALLWWAKNNNGNECYYLEDRMYAAADGDMVVILTADSYDEAKRKAKARHTQERPQGEWITVHYSRKELNVPQKASMFDFVKCPFCETIHQGRHNFCSRCGAKMKGGDLSGK